MVVALGTSDRRGHPYRPGCIDVVQDLLDPGLFLAHAGFEIQGRRAMETGRDALGNGGLREQIAG